MKCTIKRILNLRSLRAIYSINEIFALIILNWRLKITYKNIDTFISSRHSNIMSFLAVPSLK